MQIIFVSSSKQKSNSFLYIANSISFGDKTFLSLLLRHPRVIPLISKFIFETI